MLTTAGSAVVGSLVTMVAFRTRLALMQRDIEQGRTNHAALATSVGTSLKMIDKRQILTLQIMADVAHKMNVDGRFTDQIVQWLAAGEDINA